MHFPSIRTAIATLALLGASAAMASSHAGKSPTPAEKTSIETSLKDGGFSSWRAVSSDGTVWKVDDARSADGKVYDLTVDKTNFAILSRQPDSGNMKPKP